MIVETDDLVGAALDYAVAMCDGRGIDLDDPRDPWLTRDGIADQPLHSYTPSTDWAQGGPIIERECIDLKFFGSYVRALTMSIERDRHGEVIEAYAPTALVAAMRCHVAAKLGETVEIPATLNQTEKA